MFSFRLQSDGVLFESKLNRVASLSLEGYLHFLKKLVQDCYGTVREGGHVAFLMQPYLPEPFEGDRIIDIPLIVHQYFLEASFQEKNRFSVPLAREDKHKGDFEKAERDGVFINLLRDLMIYVILMFVLKSLGL